MTSSNGNIFRVTGPLCGEFTGDRRIPLTKARDAELWCFLSRFKIQDSKAFIRQCTDINHIKQRNNVKKTNQNISWWVHVWRPSLRPYGRYHKGHQKMFGSTMRIKVSRYDSNNNNNNKKKKINAKGNKCGDNAIWRVDYYKQNK